MNDFKVCRTSSGLLNHLSALGSETKLLCGMAGFGVYSVKTKAPRTVEEARAVEKQGGRIMCPRCLEAAGVK